MVQLLTVKNCWTYYECFLLTQPLQDIRMEVYSTGNKSYWQMKTTATYKKYSKNLFQKRLNLRIRTKNSLSRYWCFFIESTLSRIHQFAVTIRYNKMNDLFRYFENASLFTSRGGSQGSWEWILQWRKSSSCSIMTPT